MVASPQPRPEDLPRTSRCPRRSASQPIAQANAPAPATVSPRRHSPCEVQQPARACLMHRSLVVETPTPPSASPNWPPWDRTLGPSAPAPKPRHTAPNSELRPPHRSNAKPPLFARVQPPQPSSGFPAQLVRIATSAIRSHRHRPCPPAIITPRPEGSLCVPHSPSS